MTTTLRPTGITVLYDAQCPVCRRARRWAERHQQLVPVRFVPAGSDLARRRFPELDVGSTLVDVTVITNDGAVLRGDRAWITVLWCVTRTRPLAIRIAQGQRRLLFNNIKGATEAIRRLSATAHDAGRSHGAPAATWAPPTVRSGDDTCVSCRT